MASWPNRHQFCECPSAISEFLESLAYFASARPAFRRPPGCRKPSPDPTGLGPPGFHPWRGTGLCGPSEGRRPFGRRHLFSDLSGMRGAAEHSLIAPPWRSATALVPWAPQSDFDPDQDSCVPPQSAGLWLAHPAAPFPGKGVAGEQRTGNHGARNRNRRCKQRAWARTQACRRCGKTQRP